MVDRVMTLADAARGARGADGRPLAQVSLRAAAERGALKAHKDSRGRWVVSESALRAYLQNRPKWFRPRSR